MSGLWEFFENIDEIVYVVDEATFELVYLNQKALDTFGYASFDDVRGQLCYRVLRDSDAPCVNCDCRGMDGFCQRRYFDPRLNRYFLYKDKALEHDGRQYRLGMAADISVRNAEESLTEGLRLSLQKETPDESLDALLAYLGGALNGERTYIFERSENLYDHNTYEWVAEGIRPEKENLQNLPPEVCSSWYARFQVGKHVVIHTLEDIQLEEPQLYEKLACQDIHSLVVVPLYDEGKILGFFGVDNPPEKSLEYTSNMLEITAHFIVSTLRRRNLVRKLEDRSRDVFYALNVDYLGIYQVNFDTDECVAYRAAERLRKEDIIHFEDGYAASMEQYVSWYVVPQDQARIREVTSKDYVLEQLRTKKKFFVRCQVTSDDLLGAKNIEIHFSAVGQAGNRAIFAFRDINSLVAQEEEYKLETQRNLENVLEGSRTGIWSIELEDNCPPRMYADRTMRMLLGVGEDISPEECYQSWYRNIKPEYVHTVQKCVEEMMETGRSEVVYPWNHPEWGKIYIRCGGGINHQFKKPGICLQGYHQDITETTVTRKKQEQDIMELLEKVRQANLNKSEFLSRMSHDLRTPVNGILGMLTIMENTQDDPARQKECRDKLRISAEHLQSLVNDVLAASKLESERPVAVNEPFDVHDLLGECVTMVSPQAKEAGLIIDVDGSGVRHSKLIGDPLRVKQILMNVLENAVKYNRPNGHVWVRAAEDEDAPEGRAVYRFSVEDTGIGIGKDFLPHVFEPFSQENYGARTDYSGIGLGMPIALKMAEQLGGTITLDSRFGVGTTFDVVLPLRIDSKWKNRLAADGESGDISGVNVLLVEDNEINCEIVEFTLEKAGANVTTARDGQEAVDTFRNAEPWAFDCVLMDLMMPVMSGYEAARVIRGMDRPDAGSVPIIALSANAFDEDVAMSRAAGMNAHLSKPVDINKLFRMIHRFCR